MLKTRAPIIKETFNYNIKRNCHEFSYKLAALLLKSMEEKGKSTVLFLCIGSDRLVGDSLGPRIGTLLKERNKEIKVLGTKTKPVHALNLNSYVEIIKAQYSNSLIVAIDAAIGSIGLGNVVLREGNLLPGAGSGKRLEPVGDIAIKGIVCDRYEDLFLVSETEIEELVQWIYDGIKLIENCLHRDNATKQCGSLYLNLSDSWDV